MADKYSKLPSANRQYDSPSRPGNHRVGSSVSESNAGSSVGGPMNMKSVRSLPPPGSRGRKGQMQNLLGEFKGLYEGKLKRLDDDDKTGEETSKMRVRVLQSYVNDLSEQNEVLVQTVEELEREANERVATLEDKLKKAGDGKDYLVRSRELERELRNLSIEKTRTETTAEDLKLHVSRQEETLSQLRDQNSNLNHDIDQLISVVRTAQGSGHWEIDKVRFRELTIDQVFGSIHKTYTKSKGRDSDRDLRDQIHRRDDEIEALQQELKHLQAHPMAVEDEVSEVSSSQVSRLRSDLRKLEQKVEDLNYEIQSRERKILSLTTQVSDLQSKLSLRDFESNNQMQTNRTLQHKNRQMVQELTKCDEMNCELKSTTGKDQYANSSHDVSHYERRIRSLEAELAEAKDHRVKSLDEERLRDGHLSTHGHHEVLKSELGRRDDTIQKLRRDMLGLQDKRDSSLAECDTALHKLSVAEDHQKRTQEEVYCLEKRHKALEEEVSHMRGQLSEADNETKMSNKKVVHLEGELQSMQGQTGHFQGQVSERQEAIIKLRNDNRDIEEKLREAVTTAKHRGELVKQLKEEMKQVTANTQESKSKHEKAVQECQQLQCRYTAQAMEIDRLQTVVQEKQLTSSQQETLYHSDVVDREEEISRLKVDLNVLHEKLALSEGQLISREELTTRLQDQLMEASSDTSRKEEELCRVDLELRTVDEERKRLEDVVQLREISLQQLEHDLDLAKDKYKDAVDENGRLEVRIQVFAINAQSEQDVLSTEVKCREEGIKRLKLDIVKLQEVCSRYEEKAECEAEHFQSQLKSCHNENQSKRAALTNVEISLEELNERHGQLVEESRRLEEENRRLEEGNRRLEEENRRVEEGNRHLEDKIRELTVAITTQEAQCDKLRHTVLSRDENVQRLNMEIGKLKARHQDKTKELVECTNEIAKQSELIQKLQGTLSQCHHDLNELRNHGDKELCRKDETVKQVQEDLMESQTQHSACYNELVHVEEELELLKGDHSALNKVSQQSSVNLTSLQDRLHQLELDLTITQEKHRTCQKEAFNRDQVILRLQGDLDTSQQKYTGNVDELKVTEGELKRMSGRVKQLQHEVKENLDTLDIKDVQLSEGDKRIQQLQHDEEMALQETKNHQRSIDQLKKELEVNRNSAAAEMDRVQREMDRMMEELEVTRTDLADHSRSNAELKMTISSLNEDLVKYKTLQDESVNDIRRQSEQLKEQASILAETRQQLFMTQSQLETAHQELEQLDTSLTSYKQKVSQVTSQVGHLEAMVTSLQEKLTESRSRELDQEQTMEQQRSELEGLDRAYSESKEEICRCEGMVHQLTQELDTAQQELTTILGRVRETEEANGQLKDRLQRALDEALQNDEKVHDFENKLLKYQAEHSNSDREFADKEDQVANLVYQLEEISSERDARQRTIDQVKADLDLCQSDLCQVKEDKSTALAEMERMDQNVQQLQMNLASAQQRHKSEACHLEEQINSLERQAGDTQAALHAAQRELNDKEDQIQRNQAEIACCRDDIHSKVDEMERLERFIHDMKTQLNQLNKHMEGTISGMTAEVENSKHELSESRTQYKDCAQELAHHEEKLSLMGQSLQSTQDQLSHRVTEVVKHEQNTRKLQTQLMSVKERAESHEEELHQQKTMLDKLRKDLMSAKEEYHLAVQEGIAYKQQAHKLDLELSGAREQEKMLTDQVEQQESILGQLQTELRAERERHGDTVRQLCAAKKETLDLKSDCDTLQKQMREFQDRVKVREEQMARLRHEMDELQRKNREVMEALTESEGQLKLANMNLQTFQKQGKHHTQKIVRYEDTIAQLQINQETFQEQYRKTCSDLMEADSKIRDLKVQLTMVQGNHKEAMDQLTEMSRQLANVKTDASKLGQQNNSMKEELLYYDEKVSKLQQELRKVQEINKSTENKLQHFEERFTDLQMDLVASQEMQKVALQELSVKEEELVVLKVELSSLQEKYKTAHDNSSKVIKELELMKQNYCSATDEISSLRVALEESHSNGDRLHRESELVVQNVNTWVQEQKLANEKLGNKIREQSKAIVMLTSEKETLLEQVTCVQKSYNKTKVDLDEKLWETDKFRALQSHSAHQQVILNQLKRRLEEHEVDQDEDLRTKEATIEDLHIRLKSNIDSIRKLNQQLGSLEKDNVHLHTELERVISTRQTLQMQLQSKDQLVESLRSQLDNNSFKRPLEKAEQYKNPENLERTGLSKASEDLGVSDPNCLDKAYWIQQVGENIPSLDRYC